MVIGGRENLFQDITLQKNRNMGNTKIEWTSPLRADGTPIPGYTANLWWGCVSCSIGCHNCYAETLSNRWGNDVWGVDKPRKMISGVWKDLKKYQREAKEAGEIRRVFVGSMMDIFEKPVRLVDSKGNRVMLDGDMDWIGKTTGDLRETFFNNISRGEYPNLMFLLLTKRPGNINKYIPESWKENPPENVMFGTSPVDQETADRLIPQLMNVKGKRFLSIEPQLGPIDLTPFFMMENRPEIYRDHRVINWVINGGESGHGRRPFDLEWARSLRSQCNRAYIPFFFKQIDKVIEKKDGIPEDLQIREFPDMKLIESMKRFCPDCRVKTTQTVQLYNPDDPESGEVWECSICKENTGWVE